MVGDFHFCARLSADLGSQIDRRLIHRQLAVLFGFGRWGRGWGASWSWGSGRSRGGRGRRF